MTELPIITNKQLRNLAFIIVFATAILYIPSVSLTQAGNGAWVTPAFGLAVGTVIVGIAARLHKHHPNQTLAQYAPVIVGKWAGTLLALTYGIFFWLVGFLVTREIVSLIHLVLLLQTPLVVIYALTTIAFAFGMYAGLESLARVAATVFISLLVSFTVFFVGLVGDVHPDAYFPLFEKGWSGVLRGSFAPAMWYGNVVFITLLLPYLSDQKHPVRSVMWGLLALTAMLTVSLILIIGVLGAPEAARAEFSTLAVTQYAQWGDFFQRLDVLFIFPWLLLMIVKGLIACITANLTLAQILPVSDQRVMILPMLTMNLSITLWLFPDEVAFVQFLRVVWPLSLLFVGLILPTVLITVDAVRRRFLHDRRA